MKIYCVLLITLSTTALFAQNNYGPKIMAMANNAASVADIWSTLANPTGLIDFEKPAFAISYQKNLFSNDISQQGLSAVIPFKNNFIGIAAERYGFAAYNEIKTALSYSKLFGQQFALGITANLHQLKIANYGFKTGFSINFGALYKLNTELLLAGYLSNISNQQFSNSNVKAIIPSSISLASSYFPSNKVQIAASISKTTNQAFDTSLGIDYKIYEVLCLRAGLTANPFKQYAGFGINYNKFKFDAATSYHNSLGYNPQIGIAYEL